LDGQNHYVGGYEYNVALGSLALLIAVFGAGAVSVDRLFKRKKPEQDEDDVPTAVGPTRAPAPGTNTSTASTVTMPATRPTYVPPSGNGTPTAPNSYSNSGAPVGR
jgi:hypothetical protein